MFKNPFDPFDRASDMEKLVMDGSRRRYYRFRYSRHYGGIVTADAIGCNLLCAYCWNYFRNLNPQKSGKYYASEEVAEKLLEISDKKKVDLFRISGAEPVLGSRSMEHLVEIIKLVGSHFILETNGLMLGKNPELAEILRGRDVSVRIAVKGWDERSFERITGAEGIAFRYQLAALDELSKRNIVVWPAVMFDLFGDEGMMQIKKLLEGIGFDRIEVEELNRYPFVMENLRKRGIEI
jgi:uncharacterized Fe-S cluster-containing radical SAM superfamily protein